MENFLKMLQSVDAFFPVGAFTLSNGLEDYVLRENISCAEELADYLSSYLYLLPYQDLGTAALAWQNYDNEEILLQLDGISVAMKGAQEVRQGTIRMCSRYLKARQAMGDSGKMLTWYQEQIKLGHAYGCHSLALGIYGGEIAIDEEMLLYMYGYSLLSAAVNNAVKLVPLGQLEGQRVLFQQLPRLQQAVQRAKEVSLHELGVSGAAWELHCMNHETLYSRQYMS